MLFAIPSLGYKILVITNFVPLKIVLNDKIWILSMDNVWFIIYLISLCHFLEMLAIMIV